MKCTIVNVVRIEKRCQALSGLKYQELKQFAVEHQLADTAKSS